MEPFFLVWNPKGNQPFYQHPTEDAAKKEAKRLSEQNPAMEFFVLEALGSYATRPIVEAQWTQIVEPLPF